MKILISFLFAFILAACGGGGSSGSGGSGTTTDPVFISWNQSKYEIQTSSDSTATYQVDMNAVITGLAKDINGKPPIIGVSISYSPSNTQIIGGNGPFFMNENGYVPYTIYIQKSNTVSATYPIGIYDLKASFNIKNGNTGLTKNYSATTKLVVK